MFAETNLICAYEMGFRQIYLVLWNKWRWIHMKRIKGSLVWYQTGISLVSKGFMGIQYGCWLISCGRFGQANEDNHDVGDTRLRQGSTICSYERN